MQSLIFILCQPTPKREITIIDVRLLYDLGPALLRRMEHFIRIIVHLILHQQHTFRNIYPDLYNSGISLFPFKIEFITGPGIIYVHKKTFIIGHHFSC